MIAKKLIPRWVGLKLADPVFRILTRDLSADDWEMTYVGDGTFEFVGEASDRELGKTAAYISVVPVAYALIPIIFAAVTADGLFGMISVSVFALIGLIAVRVVGEVEVERVKES